MGLTLSKFAAAKADGTATVENFRDGPFAVDLFAVGAYGAAAAAAPSAKRLRVGGSKANSPGNPVKTNGVLIGALLAVLRPVAALVFSEEARRLLSGSLDRMVFLWDLRAGGCVATMSGHDGAVQQVRLHAARSLALSCSRLGRVKVWDLDERAANGATSLLLRTDDGGAEEEVEFDVRSSCRAAELTHWTVRTWIVVAAEAECLPAAEWLVYALVPR